jgi:hypothetical protein
MPVTEDRPVRELPKYKCHKEVWALKIKEVVSNPNESMDIFFEDESYSPINLVPGIYKGVTPEAGGYYVVYKDGYRSYSPAEAFEEGYTKI